MDIPPLSPSRGLSDYSGAKSPLLSTRHPTPSDHLASTEADVWQPRRARKRSDRHPEGQLNRPKPEGTECRNLCAGSGCPSPTNFSGLLTETSSYPASLIWSTTFFDFSKVFRGSGLGGRWKSVSSASRDLKVAVRFSNRNRKMTSPRTSLWITFVSEMTRGS